MPRRCSNTMILLVLGIGLRKKIETSKCSVCFGTGNTVLPGDVFLGVTSPFNMPDGDTKQYSSLMYDDGAAGCDGGYRAHV